MSRTYKDKKYKLRFPEESLDFSRYSVGEWRYPFLEFPGVKTKKSKKKYGGYHNWYGSTPSWWVREFMTSPKRSACRNWEKSVIYSIDLEAEDCPDYGHKPHKYYW